MNTVHLSNHSPLGQDAMQARFALRVAARLTEQTAELAPDVSERLRFAREQALERARAVRKTEAAVAPVVMANGNSATLGRTGGDGAGWWIQLGSVLPLIALVLGLVLIQRWHSGNQISAAAEIDTSLLADDLPPDAYNDPGFLEFLKAPRD